MFSDARLEQEIRSALQEEPGLEKCDIRAAVHEGVVTLDGHVDRYAATELAGRAVFRIAGVRALVNRLGSSGGPTPR
jgi:osmotically-inducible protein OsmY